MPLPLLKLKNELAEAILDLDEQLEYDPFTEELNIQFSFNGFVMVYEYSIHLHRFYDHLKSELDDIIKDNQDINECYALLDSIKLIIKESEKFNYFLVDDFYKAQTRVLFTSDVRMEASIESRFRKK